MDIFTLDLETLALNQLTHTIENWDEHAHYSPSGNRISWITSANCDCDPATIRGLEAEAWLMDADGSNKVRLTYFNEPDHPEYIGRHTIVADNAWSPDGRRLALYITNGQRLRQEKIIVLEFESTQ
jgi:Tol biopolymer transport system component